MRSAKVIVLSGQANEGTSKAMSVRIILADDRAAIRQAQPCILKSEDHEEVVQKTEKETRS